MPTELHDISSRRALRVPVSLAAPLADADVKPPGTLVRRGEALANVPPSAPAVLAPIEGEVGDVARVTLTSGRETAALSLSPISEESPPPPPRPALEQPETRLGALLADVKPADVARITDVLRVAGVWADRWTSPDLLGQLRQCLKRPVDTVVCSTLDFDSALPLQQTVACEDALEVVTAVATLAALTGAKRAWIALDGAVEAAYVKALSRWMPHAQRVRTVTLRNDYPQPNPTLLLHTLTRRQLRPGHLPTEVGVLLLDAIAASAVGRRLLYGEPLLYTPIGIADMRRPGKSSSARLLRAPIGMTTDDVLHEAGVAPGAFELRGGSVLRDVRLARPACVISASGELALYVVAPQQNLNPDPCIRCGWCVSGCPVHIHPAGILQAAQHRDVAMGERYGLASCIECGVCSYVCPSRLPLLGGIRSLRSVDAAGTL